MRQRQHGFTLIEIVLVLTILVMIMGVAYSALSSIARSKKFLDDGREVRNIANAILVRMSRELQLATINYPLLPPRDNLDKPFSGRVNLLGEDEKLPNGEPGNQITFLAQEGGQYLPDGGTHAGVVQVTYRVAKDPDAPRGDDGLFSLIREETPYLRPYKRAYEKSMIFPVTDRVVSLQFRYFDSETDEWLSGWGKDNHVRLPKFVKFEIKLRSPLGKLESYTTVVPLRGRD